MPQLASVVYHNKLGSQLERVERMQLLAGRSRAPEGGSPACRARRWLAKADLTTGMVGEFPELQGVMGRYYALHDGEPRVVADAIEAHYRPRFAGDRCPKARSQLRLRSPTSWTPWPDSSESASCRPARRTRSACAPLGVVRILVEAKLPPSPRAGRCQLSATAAR